MKSLHLDQIIFVAIIVLFGGLAIGGCFILFQEQHDCHERGGAYVKGFLTYECVVTR